MIIKTGKINKSRGNISLTIGKEDVKKHNLEEGDFVILTPQEYEELKTSSEIEVSTLEVIPDDEAVVKLEYDLKEAKSKEKILFSKVEELENINLELTTKLSQLEKANYINSSVLSDSESNSLIDEVKKLNGDIDDLGSVGIFYSNNVKFSMCSFAYNIAECGGAVFLAYSNFSSFATLSSCAF